jgi:hypothetical protein
VSRGLFLFDTGDGNNQNAVDIFGFGFSPLDGNGKFDTFFVRLANAFTDNVMFFLIFLSVFAAFYGFDGEEISDDFQFKIVLAAAGTGKLDFNSFIIDFNFKF